MKIDTARDAADQKDPYRSSKSILHRIDRLGQGKRASAPTRGGLLHRGPEDPFSRAINQAFEGPKLNRPAVTGHVPGVRISLARTPHSQISGGDIESHGVREHPLHAEEIQALENIAKATIHV